MTTTQKLLATAAVIFPAAMAIAPTVAQATPYAFASNQITGLKITFADGSSLTSIGSATTNVSDTAQFDGNAISGFQNPGVPVGQANTITQAYSGPGPTPPAVFTAVGPGNFTGTRADAAIGAGTAATGVTVSNVAEGFGAGGGNSVGNNSAAITFTVTGTGKALQLTFNDAFGLTASTAALAQETATASITNTFRVTDSSGATIFDVTPAEVNPAELTSQAGLVPSPVSGDVMGLVLTTPILTSGVTYNISLFSSSSENISPGQISPIPEPASLALLGGGLLGLGLTFRRKRS